MDSYFLDFRYGYESYGLIMTYWGSKVLLQHPERSWHLGIHWVPNPSITSLRTQPLLRNQAPQIAAELDKTEGLKHNRAEKVRPYSQTALSYSVI